MNFDDPDTAHGWFYFISKSYRPNHNWWVTSHPKLGESPLSALCDDRFEEVHAVVV